MNVDPNDPLRATLYRSFAVREICALVGGTVDPVARGQEWLVFPNVIIGVCTVGKGASNFSNAARFRWVATHDERCDSDEYAAIPPEIRHGERRPIHLFVRIEGEAYTYVGRLRASGAWGTDGHVQHAAMDLSPTLPAKVWHRLAGPTPPTDGETPAVDDALHRFDRADAHERLQILALVAGYWHGPFTPRTASSYGIYAASRCRSRCVLGTDWRETVDELYGDKTSSSLPGSSLSVNTGTSFYEENQGVFVMATERSGPDPAIFARLLDRGPWTPLGISLTEFLVQAVMLAALASPLYGASIADLDRASVESLRAAMRPVRMTPWTIPGYPTTQIEARGNALAMYMAQAETEEHHRGRYGSARAPSTASRSLATTWMFSGMTSRCKAKGLGAFQ